jgi:hypothetical protein
MKIYMAFYCSTSPKEHACLTNHNEISTWWPQSSTQGQVKRVAFKHLWISFTKRCTDRFNPRFDTMVTDAAQVAKNCSGAVYQELL